MLPVIDRDEFVPSGTQERTIEGYGEKFEGDDTREMAGDATEIEGIDRSSHRGIFKVLP